MSRSKKNAKAQSQKTAAKAATKPARGKKAAAQAEAVEAGRMAGVGETPTAKNGKKETASKPKRLSALAAAAQVLAKAGKPMRAQELIAAMTEQGLWSSPNGKTPHATLYAAMAREERDKGSASRFRKADRGQFESMGKGDQR